MTVRIIAVLLAFVFLAPQVAASRGACIPLKTYMSLTDVAYISTSPDGSRIVYTSQERGNWQAWVADADGSHRRQLTNGADSVDGAWWIPGDAHTILYSMSHGGSGVDQLYTIRDDRPGSAALLPNEKTVTHVLDAFSPDGSKIAFSSNRRNDQAFDVYVLDRKTGVARRVYTSTHSAYATDWSPDSEKLLVHVVYSPYDADLYTVDLRTGNSRALTTHSGQANFDSAKFTHDMRGVICISDLHNEFHAI
jgi:Tol biopolymer transport system component